MSENDRKRYLHHAHRMQVGVGILVEREPETAKSVRTGINSAMSDQGGLVTLLIAKGIITEDEYEKAIADAMKREADRVETELREKAGVGVTLGSLHYPLPDGE